jgi:hypothetical protein
LSGPDIPRSGRDKYSPEHPIVPSALEEAKRSTPGWSIL